MEEVAHLIIRVSSDQVDAAQKKLKNLGYESKQAEAATSGLSKASSGLMAVFGAVTAAAAVATVGIVKLYSTAANFETLRAALKTATGSAENAKTAFDAIRDFATETPFDLAQTTEAFISLVNRGLTPSERALRSYGNTASALTFQLSDMVLAVSNATAGEFENLKKFGIQARKESDGIAFTFRGTTEKVRNDTQSIENYFIKLGETNFAGAMVERMKTLGGATSNLGDAWDVLFDTISRAGVGDLMKSSIVLATDAIQELTALIESGQLSGFIDALLFKFDNLLDGVHNAISNITTLLEDAFKFWSTDGKGAVDFIVDAFLKFPENVRAVVQVVGGFMGKWVDYAVAVGTGIVDTMIAAFHLVVDAAASTGKALFHNLNPFDKTPHVNWFDGVSKALDTFGTTAAGTWKQQFNAINSADDAFKEYIKTVLDERDTSLKGFDDKIKAAKKLRKEYELTNSANSGKGKDRTERFKVGGNDRQISEEQRRRFEALRDSLGIEENAIDESYKKRHQLILDNTEKDLTLRASLEKELNKRVDIEYENAFAQRADKTLSLDAQLREAQASGRQTQVDALTLQLQHEEENIKASYDKRKQQILDDTTITEEERQKRIIDIDAKYTEIQRERERARNSSTLKTTADFFGNISTIASAFGKKGAKIAKAAAIAQATIKTYESATSAYASLAGIPYVGPALGAAAAGAAIAAGLINIAKIKSTDYSGEYEHGGMISAGKWGMVGETGMPEMVKGPAVVTSARNTADRYGSQTDAGKVTVNVHNFTDGSVSVEQKNNQDGKTIDILIKRVKSELTQEIHKGGTPFSKSIESAYALSRGKA